MKNDKRNLKTIRQERNKLREHWSTLMKVDKELDFESSIEVRKKEKEVYKKWAFYDGIIKAIDK